MIKNPWKILSTKVVYETPWLKVIEDEVIKPNGGRGTYSYVETRDQSVFIVPLTDKNEVYLICQMRYPTGVESWEIPGGNCDGDDIMIAAKKELQEETGLTAKKWTKIGWFHALNGVCPEVTNVLIAENLSQTGKKETKEEGIVKIKRVPFEKVLEMVEKNEITDGQTISSILKAKLWLEKNS